MSSESGLPVRAVHPYYQAILDAYSAAGRAFYHQVSPAQAREMLRSALAAAPTAKNLPELASVIDAVIDGPEGKISIRRYRPVNEAAGTCVYFHAGGWVIGDIALSDALCRRLAAGAGCELISVDYRLAPEHPYPAPLNDAYAAFEWSLKNTSGPVVLAGESAGANLAAACAIRARDAGIRRLAGQFLAYPVTDHDFTTGSYLELGGRNLLLSTRDMQWFWNHYCPPSVDRNDPLVSPLRVPCAKGLAAALIFVAELDPLRDEGLKYAAHLAQSAVRVKTRCDEGMLHGYLSAAGAISLAAEAVHEAAVWINNQIKNQRD